MTQQVAAGGADEARRFVERHGIVLQAARGPGPGLAEDIRGGRAHDRRGGGARARGLAAAGRASPAIGADAHAMKSAPAVLGLRAHSGWAALVALAGPADAPQVVDRRRIEMAEGEEAKQP